MATAVAKPAPRTRALEALSNLPPFPPVLMKLIASLAHAGDVPFAKIAGMIEQDTTLAGNILRLVNSPLYGRRGTVNSVRHAVTMLGLEKVRNFALSMSVQNTFRRVRTVPAWSMRDFNMSAIGVAVLSDAISQDVKVADGDSAFVAGLFHDLGKLLIAVACPNEYTALHRWMQERGTPSELEILEYERELLGLSHADLSADATAVWNLPVAIQTALRYHHTPEEDESASVPGERRLSEVVAVAVRYLKDRNEAELAALGLGAKLPGLLREFDAEYRQICGVF